MNPPTDINIHIPASIAALRTLNLIEKVILSRIHERPACSNGDLATLTGLSERGVESTVARLKKQRLIRNQGHGQARRLMLTFLVEHHSACGETTNAKSHTECGLNQIEDTHTKCGVSANAECHTNGGIQPEEIQFDLTNNQFLVKELYALNLCLPTGDFSQAQKHLARVRQWWSAFLEKVPDSREKAEGCLRVLDHIIFILEAGWPVLEILPTSERNRLTRLLSDTDPERLAEIQQQIKTATARGERVDLKRLLEG